MHRPSLVNLLLALSTAGLIVLLARSESQERHDPRSSVEPAGNGLAAVGPALRSIEERLAHIEDILVDMESTASVPALPDDRGPASVEQESPTEIDRLRGQLEQLQLTVAAQVEAASSERRLRRSARELATAHPEPRWDELQELMDLWFADEALALRDLRLASVEDVIRRFGAPMDVWSNDLGTNWVWGQGDDPAGGYQTEVWICFKDGYVTMLGVK